MPNPEKVFRLKYLDVEQPATYMLTVIQALPFGVGKHSFLVDSLEYEETCHWFVAKRKDDSVVAVFPDSYTYFLVNLNQYEVVSFEDAQKEMKDADAEGGEKEVPLTEETHTRGYV